MEDSGIVLFDGVCNMCNGAVDFILQRDSAGRFKFASLQSEAAQAIYARHGRKPGDLSTMALVEDGKIYTRSTAALRIARRLDGLWPLMYGFIVVPPILRDAIYRWVAANRYRWFGKRETCRVPTPDEQARFLDVAS